MNCIKNGKLTGDSCYGCEVKANECEMRELLEKGRKAAVHKLKIRPKYFKAITLKEKNFELRKDDRGYKVGDMLYLKEWDKEKEVYTGNERLRTIRYILRDCPEYGLRDGYCILGF